MTDRHDNNHDAHPDWIPTSRPCPFCDVPALHCGCPTGDRIEEQRAKHWDTMGCE